MLYEAGEIEWNARYGDESMVRAFYCNEFAGFTTEELHEYLAVHRSQALRRSSSVKVGDTVVPAARRQDRPMDYQAPVAMFIDACHVGCCVCLVGITPSQVGRDVRVFPPLLLVMKVDHSFQFVASHSESPNVQLTKIT
jgi:hypothetical protein